MRARRSRSIRPISPVFQRAQVRCAMSPSNMRASASVSSHARNRLTVVRASAARLLVGDDGKIGASGDGLDRGELHGILLWH